ncbi:MAG: hypothetical protein DWQ10_07425 [Calditrichaeota bacterium]|nr:MAG: hypothetical protein DWQ10_07425 [Calditrichota bacterium]
MKRISLFCYAIALLMNIGFSQTIPGSKTITSVPVPIEQINSSTYEGGLYDIGRRTESSNVYIARSYYVFDLSNIPNNATITQVKVIYSTSGSGYSFKLTKVGYISYNPEDDWNTIGSSTELKTGISYGSSNFISDDLKTDIQNAIGGEDAIALGGVSENEGTNGSNSYLDLSLDVDYTTPASEISVTVRNDLDGADGGNIGSAIYPASATSHTSPYTFDVYEQKRLNLAAYDNQSINGRTWFFNDSEYPFENSKWEKEVGGNVSFLSNSASFTTAQLTESDDNAIFNAFLKNATYTTSGALSDNEMWIFPATLTGNVTVPSSYSLTIASTSTVNLNGYSIKSTGGAIVQESGSTINGLDAYLKYYSTLKGLYSSVSSAVSNAGYYYTVELLNKTYNQNFSITNNSNNIRLKGVSGTVVNGHITITNSSWCSVGDFRIGNYKTITINGGTGSRLENIVYNSNAHLAIINVYSGVATGMYNLDYDGQTTDFAWNFYNSNTNGLHQNHIEGYDIAINSASNSYVGMSSASFCENELDLYAAGGSSIYAIRPTLSYPGAYSGNCDIIEPVQYCGGRTQSGKSQMISNTTSTSSLLFGANTLFIDLFADDNLSRESVLSEEIKNQISAVISTYKSAITENLTYSELKKALSRISACYRLLGKEDIFAGYISGLVGNQNIPIEMIRFTLPDLVKQGNYKDALNLIDGILNYKDIPKDLGYELLYEKGTILKYALNDSEQAEKVFLALYNNSGDHVLANFAKAQLESANIESEKDKPIIENFSNEDNLIISAYPNPEPVGIDWTDFLVL